MSAGVVAVSAVISPVVPRLLPRSGDRTVGHSGVVSLVRGPLPLPLLITARTSAIVYGLSAVDDRGRVADRVVMRALGWSAGLRLAIRETGGVLTVRNDPDGGYQITSQGHLRLPAPLRHRCDLHAGDRVLLAADPHRSRLDIYPPAALDSLITPPDDPAGGEPA
jgi:hypothetical protein